MFPLFFFLVAALVALTTMTRMVEEERQQVGTLKALGYSTAKIAWKYLLYAAMASIAGSVIGLAVGTRLFPYIIINAYNIMYDVPEILTPFHVPYALVSSVSMIACTLLVTLFACWSELREVPATLMLPKAPKAGKRIFLEYITPLWSRLKFTSKVTARNLFRYKKRFFMTVVGIAGCTALLVTGFGVRDSVSDIVGLQYGELNQYQLTLGLRDPSALEGRDLQAVLEDSSRIESSLAVMQQEMDIVPDEGRPADSLVVFVPQDVDALGQYFQFRHRTNSQEVTFDQDAVVVTEKICERQGWKVGDTITLQDDDGNQAQLTITDICENYIYHYVYISPKTYQEAFGKEMEANSLLCKLPEDLTAQEEERLGTDLLQCRDVVSAQFTDTLSESFNNSITSINSIIVVLIVSAGLLAFVVLYNLTNINITEREKELATIKVLGFYDGGSLRVYLPGNGAPHPYRHGAGPAAGHGPAPVCHTHRRGGHGHVRPGRVLAQLCVQRGAHHPVRHAGKPGDAPQAEKNKHGGEHEGAGVRRGFPRPHQGPPRGKNPRAGFSRPGKKNCEFHRFLT